jgi:hypothetical protein
MYIAYCVLKIFKKEGERGGETQDVKEFNKLNIYYYYFNNFTEL